jgi:hypothetical protein
MAKIVVENATVEKVFETKHGWGVRLVETVKRRGENAQERCTAWFYGDRFGIEEGDVVSLAGTLSTRIRDYEAEGQTRRVIDVSMNSPQLVAAGAQPEPTSHWAAPAGEEF